MSLSAPPEIQSNLLNPEVDQTLVELLPDFLKQRIKDAMFERPEYFGIDEDELKKKIKADYGKIPTTTENQLRLKLWYEYDMARAGGYKSIDIRRVYYGVCIMQVFRQFLQQNACVAWLVCTPVSYDRHLEELLNFGAAKMREIMKMEAVDPLTRKTNVSLLKLQTQIYLSAEMRKFGGITQVTKNLNYNAYANLPPTGENTGEVGSVTVQKKIDFLREKEASLVKILPREDKPIDV